MSKLELFEESINEVINILPEPTFSESATTILEKRYLRKDKVTGVPYETPKELLVRVAKLNAKQELEHKSVEETIEYFKEIYGALVNFKFLPNSPTLMNAGTEINQLHACFVLPVEDSIESIYTTIKDSAVIQKSGGGVGYNFSKLRSKDAIVGTTGGQASGPVSFMKIFNESTEQIKQGGVRRGAAIGILDISHPDIEEFINCKDQQGVLTNFNISIAITDDFINKVKNNEDFDLVDPSTKQVIKTVNAKELMTKIADHAWVSGDPGLVFLDTIRKNNPIPSDYLNTTNPCGEIILFSCNDSQGNPGGESCVLGSIDLSKFVLKKYEYSHTDLTDLSDYIDYDGIEKYTRLLVNFLDNSLDASTYPLPAIREITLQARKIGLGIMGLADMLFKLEVPYNSETGREIARIVMSLINDTAYLKSVELGKEKGSFPKFYTSVYGQPDCSDIHRSSNLHNLLLDETPGALRNATRTTIAPTGTLSMLADCSSGLEPLFSLAFVKRVMDDTEFIYVNPHFEQALIDYGTIDSDIESIKTNLAKYGNISNLPEDVRNRIPEKLQSVFVTAQEISYEDHVLMQATLQKHVDNSISKTINMDNSATKEDVLNAYMFAYEQGCKGVTIYRDGCLDSQVLHVGTSISSNKEESSTIQQQEVIVRERPDCLNGFTQKIQTGLGCLYVTVNEDEQGRPFEVFATIGKSGKSIAAKAEAVSRLVSLALRSGVHMEDIIKQIEGIGGEHPVFQKKGMVLSIPDAIAKVLREKYTSVGSSTQPTKTASLDGQQSCPDCGTELVLQEGCCLCPNCGYSKCG